MTKREMTEAEAIHAAAMEDGAAEAGFAIATFPTPRSSDPFDTGLHHGLMTRKLVSNRQVSEQYPDYSAQQIELYQNGRDDGVEGDLWRFKNRREG